MSEGRRTIFVTGATATGKSAWALEVARRAGAVILNCDSIQVYQRLRVGSSLPTEAEFAEAPHYLYSFVPPGQELDAGAYRERFFATWEGLEPEARVLVVGGTGFYFQAVERGMYEVPAVADAVHDSLDELYARVDATEAAWAELCEGDPVEAARLHPSDRYRVRRALELLRSGRLPSAAREAFVPREFPGPLMKTTLRWERPALWERIARRTRGMIAAGLLDETQGLLEEGWADWAPLASVGYKQAVSCLRGELAREALADEIDLRTRQLAKRQETWFKRDPATRAFDGARDEAAFVEACLRFFDDGTILGAT